MTFFVVYDPRSHKNRILSYVINWYAFGEKNILFGGQKLNINLKLCMLIHAMGVYNICIFRFSF